MDILEIACLSLPKKGKYTLFIPVQISFRRTKYW